VINKWLFRSWKVLVSKTSKIRRISLIRVAQLNEVNQGRTAADKSFGEQPAAEAERAFLPD